MTLARRRRRGTRQGTTPAAADLELWRFYVCRREKWERIGAVHAASEYHAIAYGARAYAFPVYAHQDGKPFKPGSLG